MFGACVDMIYAQLPSLVKKYIYFSAMSISFSETLDLHHKSIPSKAKPKDATLVNSLSPERLCQVILRLVASALILWADVADFELHRRIILVWLCKYPA